MISAYRICGTKWVSSAFTGEGAKLTGGRWNTSGVPAVYCASSLSLATLEVLVHLEDTEILANYFSYFRIEIPDSIVAALDTAELPENWKDESAMLATRALGDSWLQSMKSAVLSVPSAVTPGELNFLLNPRHPDFGKIGIGAVQTFLADPRLVKY